MIDHLVYGAPDLGAAVDDLDRRFSARAAAGSKHLAIGTHVAHIRGHAGTEVLR